MIPLSNEGHITLKQGLQKFYTTYEGQLSHNDESLPDEVKSFFRSHDIAHVLFGCDISLFGEGAVKLWTIFGTTLGFWKHLHAYRKANAFELSKRFNILRDAPDLFRLFVSIPVIIYRTKKMYKPWPWADFNQYLDTSIDEIRQEFNIVVLS